MEKINLSEFDIMGIFTLKDVKGIEDFVTPLVPGEYLSRSSDYYGAKSFTELSAKREYLKNLLTDEPSKRNFVILENMLNCSAKEYYSSLLKYITDSSGFDNYEICKKCLEDDVGNIVNILSKKPINVSENVLPVGKEKSADRAIELDNKALLYIFCKNIALPEDSHVVTPGYGAVYIGPFLKSMQGAEYSNVLKSTYIKEKNELKLLEQKNDFFELVSDKEKLQQAKNLVLLDDNIGTGQTMDWFKEKFAERNLTFMSGAVQYNWINYYRFSIGEKDQRFDISKYEFMTPFNYPGHKLLEHAIDNLKISGPDYVKYLQSKSYRNPLVNDFEGAIVRSEYYAGLLELNLYTDKGFSDIGRRSNLRLKNHVFQLFKTSSDNINSFREFFIDTLKDNHKASTNVANASKGIFRAVMKKIVNGRD